MLDLARATGCYRQLERANLLLPKDCPALGKPYDFVITMGLMGDYVPYYIALPHLVSLLRPGAFAGYAVERRSTPSRALEKLSLDLGLVPISETVLPVPEGNSPARPTTFSSRGWAVGAREGVDRCSLPPPPYGGGYDARESDCNSNACFNLPLSSQTVHRTHAMSTNLRRPTKPKRPSLPRP